MIELILMAISVTDQSVPVKQLLLDISSEKDTSRDFDRLLKTTIGFTQEAIQGNITVLKMVWKEKNLEPEFLPISVYWSLANPFLIGKNEKNWGGGSRYHLPISFAH